MSTPTPPTVPEPQIVQGNVGDTPQPVQWYKSQRFIILVQSTVLLVLGWLIQTLSATPVVWAWKAILIAVLGNILLALKDWWSPTIIAPFAVLNKNNVK
jgi:hypothetical protein